MRIILASNRQAIERLASRDEARSPEVERQAARIVADVRRRGDRALRDWTRRLDGARVRTLGPADLMRGWAATPPDVRP